MALVAPWRSQEFHLCCGGGGFRVQRARKNEITQVCQLVKEVFFPTMVNEGGGCVKKFETTIIEVVLEVLLFIVCIPINVRIYSN